MTGQLIMGDSVELQRVTLDIYTAMSILGVVVMGVASTIASIYAVTSKLRREMVTMANTLEAEMVAMRKEQVDIERRWVDRAGEVEKNVRQEIKELKANIPPPEVRQRFDMIEKRLDKIEQKVEGC